MQAQLAELQRHAICFASTLHDNVFGKPERETTKETTLNSKLVTQFKTPETLLFKMDAWEQVAACVQVVASVAMVAVAVVAVSTTSLTALTFTWSVFVIGGAAFLGLNAAGKIANAFRSVHVGTEHKIYLDLKEKSVEELDTLYEELVGKSFENSIEPEMKETLKKETGYDDVRSLLPLLAEALYEKGRFENRQKEFKEFEDISGYVRGIRPENPNASSMARQKEEAAEKTLDMLYPPRNRFLMEKYAPAKLDYAFSLYKLSHPEEKGRFITSKGHFVTETLETDSEVLRNFKVENLDIPAFKFTVVRDEYINGELHAAWPSDILTFSDLFRKSQDTGEFCDANLVADMLTDTFSEQNYEIEARKKLKAEAEAEEVEAPENNEAVVDEGNVEDVQEEPAAPKTPEGSPPPAANLEDAVGADGNESEEYEEDIDAPF